MQNPSLTIAAVERDTGLPKDTLRMWERRYGFPAPQRDAHGERLYPPEQVARLRLIKRLLDRGLRPGKLVQADTATLQALLAGQAEPPSSGAASPPAEDELIALLQRHDVAALRSRLHALLARQGLQTFVLETAARCNVAVGEAWLRGDIEVFEEHLYTEEMQGLLRHAVRSLPGNGRSPRVLLTTLPDELHGLGLLMAEVVLSLEGAECINLGTATPLGNVLLAAHAHQARVVALSFSAHTQARATADALVALRASLPPDIALWAGGAGVARLPGQERLAGVHCFTELAELPAALASLRQGGPG